MLRYVLSIDEGTTGVRAMIFDQGSALVGSAYEEIVSSFPRPGWMEQDPVHIWEATRRVMKGALEQAGLAFSAISAIGVATQRATTVVWERRSGLPVYPAISWQDARTAARVETLLAEGVYSNSMASATKIEWILRHCVDGLRRAAAGELCFGNMDSWLVWQLSGGRAHVTDHSNASCTGLYDFASGWDANVLGHLGLPEVILPSIGESSQRHAETDREIFGAALPVAGIAGDQQAAMFGELATDPGAVKVTYGTSAMIDINTGERLVGSEHGAFPLVLWSLDGRRLHCLEGTVVTAGAAMQWLRDGLGIIDDLAETGHIAASVADSGGVWAVPALQGLGTPHMDPAGRGVIGGLSRGTTRAHVVRAMLEGIAFRSREVLGALLGDAQVSPPARLRVDGGAAVNDFLLQMLADALGQPVERPETVQATALGAAYLAGMAVGVWEGLDDVRHAWRSGGVFEPRGDADEREARFRNWQERVAAARPSPTRSPLPDGSPAR